MLAMASSGSKRAPAPLEEIEAAHLKRQRPADAAPAPMDAAAEAAVAAAPGAAAPPPRCAPTSGAEHQVASPACPGFDSRHFNMRDKAPLVPSSRPQKRGAARRRDDDGDGSGGGSDSDASAGAACKRVRVIRASARRPLPCLCVFVSSAACP